MGGFPQPIEKRLVALIRTLEQKVKRLEHVAADPVAIGNQLARTSIQSPNFMSGQSGWVLNADGTGEFTSDVAAGTTVTIGTTAPTDPKAGDLWYDANNDFQLNQWDGTQWLPYQFGTNAIVAGSVDASLIAANAVVAGMIAAGAIDGLTINGVQINGNVINATDILISGINSGIFVYGGGVGGTYTYTASGNWICPPNTTSVTVELWAAGAGGGGNGGTQNLISGGGGSGGMYTKWTYPVTPGNAYAFTIPGPGSGGGYGADGTNGGDATFDNAAATPLRAFGGVHGNGGNSGAGGGNAVNTAPTVPAGATLVDWQPGGNGGDGKSGGPVGGGGGAGSGAPGLAGKSGGDGEYGKGGRGYAASAQPGGGPGGRGGGATGAPFDGSSPTAGPGGGGGGGAGDGGGHRVGAAGWKGQMRLTWTPSLTTLTGSISGQVDTDPLGGQNVPEGAMFDRVTTLDTPPGSTSSWPLSSVLHSVAGHQKYAGTDGNLYATGRQTILATGSTNLGASMTTMGGLTASLGTGTYRVIARLLLSVPATAGQGALSYRVQPGGGLIASTGRTHISELYGANGVGNADHVVLGNTVVGSTPGTGGANREVLFDGWFTVTTAGTISIQAAQASTAAVSLAFGGSYLEIMPVP